MENNSVLIVDDDYGILDTMKDVLETEGYNVETTSNGYDAVDMIKLNPYKLAVVDIKMPKIGGIGVLKALHEVDPGLPVIMFTGHATVETATEAIRLGAYDYITKPFEWDRFLNVMKRAIERRDLLLNNKTLLKELSEANEQLKDRIGQLYKLNEIGNAMNNMFDEGSLTDYILDISCKMLGADRGTVLLFDDTNYNLTVRAVHNIDFPGIKDIIYKRGEGFIGFLVERDKLFFRPKNLHLEIAFSKKDDIIGSRAEDFLSFPLKSKDKMLGLLNLSGFKNISDMESCFQLGNILSVQAATAIDNARLYRNMQNSYLGVMEVLISAMESKSRYTRGHSERVANFSFQFCLDLNLSPEDTEHIIQASRLHDIGKITISDLILNKSERLTEEEWEEIRMHPVRGSDTLKPLGFLNGISPVIRSHHERFDGKGYPDGLYGKNVLLGARVISIIDSFDAMISERPYRKPLSMEKAADEIKKNKGTQFDPDFTDIFLNVTLPKIKKRF